MSTTPQGPGWWQASDLNWYPPAEEPGPSMPAVAAAGQGQGPARVRGSERTSAQIIRNGSIMLVVLLGCAGALGWGITSIVDSLEAERAGTAAERIARICEIERRTLATMVAAAASTPEPDVWSDYLDPTYDPDYWTVVGDAVVPIGELPAGCG